LHASDLRKASKNFFFEKKKQKTFIPAGCGAAVANARKSKSFLLLFFKKEALSSRATFLLRRCQM
jgi:hypothetical protein